MNGDLDLFGERERLEDKLFFSLMMLYEIVQYSCAIMFLLIYMKLSIIKESI